MGNWVDPWSIFGILVVLLIAGWGVKILRSKIEEQRYKEEMDALAFEQSVISQIASPTGAGESDSRFIVNDEPIFVGDSTPVVQYRLDGNATSTNAPEISATPSEMLIERLQRGGLITSIEGHLELHGDPKGVTIVRLRNGKTGLIVPNMESESFLRRNSRRADMIFLCASDKNVYVVRRVEEVIAEML